MARDYRLSNRRLHALKGCLDSTGGCLYSPGAIRQIVECVINDDRDACLEKAPQEPPVLSEDKLSIIESTYSGDYGVMISKYAFKIVLEEEVVLDRLHRKQAALKQKVACCKPTLKEFFS